MCMLPGESAHVFAHFEVAGKLWQRLFREAKSWASPAGCFSLLANFHGNGKRLKLFRFAVFWLPFGWKQFEGSLMTIMEWEWKLGSCHPCGLQFQLNLKTILLPPFF